MCGAVSVSAQINYDVPYTFTTIAGRASQGSTDGKGSAARFNGPKGLVTDAKGTIYIADSGSHTIRKMTRAGVVTTFAGSPGIRGHVDGTGSKARFGYLTGITLDAAGNLYVVDEAVIRKVSPKGKVSTVAGESGRTGTADGAGKSALFLSPFGIACAPDGTLYVTDAEGCTIRKIDPSGKVTTIAGSPRKSGSDDGKGEKARFSRPTHIVMDRDGNLIVVDDVNLRKVTPKGSVTTVSPAFPWTISALCGDGSGNLYVSSRSGEDLVKIKPNGSMVTIVEKGNLGGGEEIDDARGPFGLTWDGDGTLYFSVPDFHVIRKLSPDGKVTTVAGFNGRGSTDGAVADARLAYPEAIAVDKLGRVYFADSTNHTIRRIADGKVETIVGLAGHFGDENGSGADARTFDPGGVDINSSGALYFTDGTYRVRRLKDGNVTTVAGSSGGYYWADGTASEARFRWPAGVAFDQHDNLYVADAYNHAIRKITPSGKVSTIAGKPYVSGWVNGKKTAARFDRPSDVAVGGDGTIYVADTDNHTIRKITPKGVVTTLAGIPKEAGHEDGKGSSARFSFPGALDVDGDGNVFVADYGNSAIRRIAPNGTVTTIAGGELAGAKDGTGRSARFYVPNGIAVDAKGVIYVADSGNHAIRRGVLAQPPKIAKIKDVVIPKDGRAKVAVSLSDADTATSKVKLTRSSSNKTLLPHSRVTLSGSGDQRTLTLKPAAKEAGSAKITLTANDGTFSSTRSFKVIVHSPPKISKIADQTVSVGGKTKPLKFTLSDGETAVSKLKISAKSSKTSLVPTKGIVLGGSGKNRTVTVAPSKGKRGSAKITLTVSDAYASTSTSFMVTVNSVPTISAIADQSIGRSRATPTLKFKVSDQETSSSKLRVTASSSNTALVPASGIELKGTGKTRAIKVRPVARATGVATITVTVSDGHASAQTAFKVTVR